jgi:hypothetical protein
MIAGEGLDGVVDSAGVLADDDGAAAGGHDVGGGLAPHTAAAADDHQFLPGEDGHGLRPAGLGRVVRALEPVPVSVHSIAPFGSGACPSFCTGCPASR